MKAMPKVQKSDINRTGKRNRPNLLKNEVETEISKRLHYKIFLKLNVNLGKTNS